MGKESTSQNETDSTWGHLARAFSETVKSAVGQPQVREKEQNRDSLKIEVSQSTKTFALTKAANGKTNGRTKLNGKEKVRHETVTDFLKTMQKAPTSNASRGSGHLIFALDATHSRQDTWAQACDIQGEMFKTAASLGGLSVQLVHFRGIAECKPSPWADDPTALMARMRSVHCMAGMTQICKVLRHALKETRKQKIDAVVYVGDAVEEDRSALRYLAGELGLVGVPVFVFQEGCDPKSKTAFEDIARLSGGAYASFDLSSPWQLRELLSAVAVYAAGGRKALADHTKGRDQIVGLLTHQVAPTLATL